MIETLLEFPCEMDIKIFVKSSESNSTMIRQLLLSVLAPDYILNISQRSSKSNQYQSYSCTVNAQSKQKMDELYQYLSDHPDVLMTL